MKVRFILFFIIALLSPARSIWAGDGSGVEIHENLNASLAYNFTEDVLALLPVEMAQFLIPDIKQLHSRSTFRPRSDYWKKPVIDKQDFIRLCNGIDSGSSTELANGLGETTRNIFEITMRSSGDDLLGDKLRRNLLTAFRDYHNNEYLIEYSGYNGVPLANLVDKLYEMRNHDKASLYPHMVCLTANIWTSIWAMRGHKITSNSHTILRKPYHVKGELATNLGQPAKEAMKTPAAEEKSVALPQLSEAAIKRKERIKTDIMLGIRDYRGFRMR